MELYDIKRDYHQYSPHITLSYNYEESDVPNIKDLNFDIKGVEFVFTKEYRKDFRGRDEDPYNKNN